MPATERFRALLDERGVEHIDYEDEATWWSNGNVECAYIQSAILGDKLGQLSFMATPEQAIEATLGRETCKFEVTFADNGWIDHTCSGCGYVENTDVHVFLGYKYCPMCGRKVVE